VDDAGLRRPAHDALVGDGVAGEQAEETRVDAVQHHGLGGPVLDDDGDVGEPLEQSVGKLAQGLLGDLLEALRGHARRVGLAGCVETQHGEPLARRPLPVVALVEGGAEQPARVGLLLDREAATADDVLEQLDRSPGVAEVLEVDLGGGDHRRRVVRVGLVPALARLEGPVGIVGGEAQLDLEVEDTWVVRVGVEELLEDPRRGIEVVVVDRGPRLVEGGVDARLGAAS